jgi:hypothetical protein
MNANRLLNSGIILLVLISFVMTGCGFKTNIRASETMLSENPMKKVILLSGGKLNWPGFRGKMCIRKSDSLKAVEAMIQLTKDELSAKGYEVISAEPVGVGFQSKNWWLLPETAKDNTQEEQVTLITSEAPLYVCSNFQGETPYEKAVVKLYDLVEFSFQQGTIDEFVPDKTLVATIAEATQADTLCLNRVSGAKFTAARKTGTAILGALFGTYGGASDALGSYYVFIDAHTGEVLWQSGYFVQGDPLAPNAAFIKNAFKYLPDAGQPFDSTRCQKGEKQGYVSCK